MYAHARQRKLAALAEALERLQTQRAVARERIPSDWPVLDAALCGGFGLGAVHEFVTDGLGVPAWTMALHVAVQALKKKARRHEGGGTKARRHGGTEGSGRPPCRPSARSGRRLASRRTAVRSPLANARAWIVYVDTTGTFYPPAAAALGVPLARLVLVRARQPAQAQWVCEQALRCKAVAAVVAPLAQIDAQRSRRLQLAAEIGGGVGLLLREDRGRGHTFATTRLRLEPLPATDGSRRTRVTVLKVREGQPGTSLEITMPDSHSPSTMWNEDDQPGHQTLAG